MVVVPVVVPEGAVSHLVKVLPHGRLAADLLMVRVISLGGGLLILLAGPAPWLRVLLH